MISDFKASIFPWSDGISFFFSSPPEWGVHGYYYWREGVQIRCMRLCLGRRNHMQLDKEQWRGVRVQGRPTLYVRPELSRSQCTCAMQCRAHVPILLESLLIRIHAVTTINVPTHSREIPLRWPRPISSAPWFYTRFIIFINWSGLHHCSMHHLCALQTRLIDTLELKSFNCFMQCLIIFALDHASIGITY